MILAEAWSLAKRSVAAFVDDEALSRGAAIAFYAITSIGPVLLIVISLAGLIYGEEAARGALLDRLRGLMGEQSAAFLQGAIRGASDHGAGVLGTLIGIVSLVLSASGVFGEMQTALNAIWRAEPHGSSWRRLIRARLVSLGLVASLGVVLIVSLVLSAVVAGLKGVLEQISPLPVPVVEAANFLVSVLLLTMAIAAIYKILPDRDLDWGDVICGAVVTAVLITLGKLAIGWYIGNNATISSLGAAGSVLAALFWIYYSAQIFLLGAEFTRVYAERERKISRLPVASALTSDRGSAVPDQLSPPAG